MSGGRWLAGGLWALASFWLLALGLLINVWDNGALRAALLLGVAALAVWLLRQSPAAASLESPATPSLESPAPRALKILTLALLVAHCAYAAVRASHLTHLPDIAGTTLEALNLAARGSNPYMASIDTVAIEENGPAFGGYKYLPTMLLVFAPLGLSFQHYGMLLTNLTLDLITAALVWLAARRAAGSRAGWAAAAIWLSLPVVYSALFAKLYTDLAPVVLLLGAMLVFEARPAGAGLLFGLSLAAKLLPGLAVAPALLPTRARWRFALGLIAGAAPIGLAWLSAPQAFDDNIIRFNFIRPVDSSSWMQAASPPMQVIGRAAFASAWLVVSALTLRRGGDLARRSALMTLMLLATILAGPVAHQNYLLWWMPFFCIALGARLARA